MAKYLISKVGDPLFAIFIGVSAAAVRIRREEAEQGRTPADSWEGLKHKVSYYFGEESKSQPVEKQ